MLKVRVIPTLLHKSVVILVASPDLATAHCKSPRQMQLVNALCSYLERAAVVSPACSVAGASLRMAWPTTSTI